MSNLHLPPEILDYTVDFLHDKPATLKQCCLVSKSWVPRTRGHLFASISFDFILDIEAWKKTFSNPENSPANYTRSLYIGSQLLVTAADTEEGGWIRAFSRVVQLKVHTRYWSHQDSELSFVHVHNFSPVLQSFQVYNFFPRSRVFSLVCSLPLLEDLNIREYGAGDGDDGIDFQPLASPPLTGTFELDTAKGAGSAVRRLLNLPGGFRFRKLVLTWYGEVDLRWIMALVAGCSDTLECFHFQHIEEEAKHPVGIDLSKATKLKKLIFQCGELNAIWITTALQTITSKHQDLQQIVIRIPYYYYRHRCEPVDLRKVAGEANYRQWMDLDRLLVQLVESRAIRTKVTHGVENKERKLEMCEHIMSLLPGVGGRGTIHPFACGGRELDLRTGNVFQSLR